MIHYNPADIVIIPFPFVDKDKSKPRPTLVIASNENVSVLAMITTASGGMWDDDILIDDLDSAGLPSLSYVRMKIFTLDTDIIKRKIGILSKKDTKNVRQIFGKIFHHWF